MSINIPVFIDARKQEHVLLMIESLIAALEVNLKQQINHFIKEELCSVFPSQQRTAPKELIQMAKARRMTFNEHSGY